MVKHKILSMYSRKCLVNALESCSSVTFSVMVYFGFP